MIEIVRRLYDMLGRMEQKLDLILKAQGMQMATIQDVKAETEKQTTVVQSAVTLLGQLSGLLKTAQASGDPAAVQAVIDQIDANNAALAGAVAANTPAAPEPPKPAP